MALTKSLTSLFLSLLLGPTCFAQLAVDVDSVVNKHISEGAFSGTVLLARNGTIIYDKSTGYSDVDSKTLNTSSTRFSLASIGKMITGTLIMKLVEEGKVNLDEVVNTYLPEWKVPNGDKITIKNLLTHKAGLGEYMDTSENDQNRGKQSTIDQLMKIIVALPLRSDSPGTRFMYSNSGFIVLGKIIEKIEGKPYYQVLEARILWPLKMKSATFSIDLTNLKGFAKGYVDEGGNLIAKTDITSPSSDGGMFITAHDFLKFDQGLFSGKIISSSTLKIMETPQPGSPSGYAMMITRISNGVGYGHNGGMPGYQSEYRHFYIGEDEFTVIIFANRDRKAMRLLTDLFPALEKLKGQ